MKCWNCGNETASGARFCGVCGVDLSQAPQGQP
ncbi:MAG: zinc-ribbon domain-containing protein, partial [Oscillospiraceae bacterium]|nr:zinc-ribbon domain-containing protein [Oscillospiraceae bacterium]MDE7004889.1 zinc-ribbon domain-containing protein [Oscillospiraceae bacterium]